jgi:hypothetical protein
MNTNQIQIYVRSSALGPAGIHWRNVSKPEQPKEEPEILGQAVVPDEGSKISIDSAINTVKPCLVLAKYDGQILLEVTGIDATRERCEQEGRRISEVVLWVGDDNKETEERLRKLAYCALLGLWKPDSKFRTEISSSIKFDGLNDYKVKADDLNKIYECPENYTENLELEDSSHPNHNYLESNKFKTDQEVIQLATQLRDESFDGMETVVVISEVKQTESERWLNHRGNVAQQPEVTPIILEREPVTPLQGGLGSKKPERETSKPKIRSRLIVIGIALILILGILIAMGQKHLMNQEKTIDQNIPVLNLVPTPKASS